VPVMVIYAGIGSQQTPESVLLAISALADVLGKIGWLLRSGGAQGADRAFEEGCDNAGGHKEIWKTKHCRPEWEAHASLFHPAWGSCSPYVRQLHGRNSAIILGQDLATPADLVICWTLAGLEGGGTGQGLRIARSHNIPIVNLANSSLGDAMDEILKIGSKNRTLKTG
jgi:hypothetical protein